MKISCSTQTFKDTITSLLNKPPKELNQNISNDDLSNIEPTDGTAYPLKPSISYRNLKQIDNNDYPTELNPSLKALSCDKLDQFDTSSKLVKLNNKSFFSYPTSTDKLLVKHNKMFHNAELANKIRNKQKQNSIALIYNNNNNKTKNTNNNIKLPELTPSTPIKDIHLFFDKRNVYENESNFNKEAFMTIKHLLYYKIVRAQERNNININNKKLNSNTYESNIYNNNNNRHLHSIEMNLNIENNSLLKGVDSERGVFTGIKAVNNVQRNNNTKNEGKGEVLMFKPDSFVLNSVRNRNKNKSHEKTRVYKVDSVVKNNGKVKHKRNVKEQFNKSLSIKKTAHAHRYDLIFSSPVDFFLVNNPHLAYLKINCLKNNISNKNMSLDSKYNKYLKNKEDARFIKHLHNFST